MDRYKNAEVYSSEDNEEIFSVRANGTKFKKFISDLYVGRFPYHKLAFKHYGKDAFSSHKWWIIAEANDIINPFKNLKRNYKCVIPLIETVVDKNIKEYEA